MSNLIELDSSVGLKVLAVFNPPSQHGGTCIIVFEGNQFVVLVAENDGDGCYIEEQGHNFRHKSEITYWLNADELFREHLINKGTYDFMKDQQKKELLKKAEDQKARALVQAEAAQKKIDELNG